MQPKSMTVDAEGAYEQTHGGRFQSYVMCNSLRIHRCLGEILIEGRRAKERNRYE